jgi:putative ABC transport system permease protein
MPYSTRTPAWRRYLRFWKSNVKSDVDAELQFHFDARIDELMALGESPSAAHAKALDEFGDLGETRQALHAIDARIAQRQSRLERLRGWRDDAAYGIRSLLRTPSVTITIIVTLALGLGMNAAMFSFLDQVFARLPAGVVRPESLRRLWFVQGVGEPQVPAFWPHFDYPGYRAVAEAVGDRARTTMYAGPDKSRLGGGENPPQAQVVFAGAGYFELLGIRPQVGRLLSADENRPGAGVNVAVVSDAYWHSAFGGDSSVIGRRLTIEKQPYTIVGVAQRDFTGLDLDATDIWLPLGSYPSPAWIGEPWWQSRNISIFPMLLQPKPGVSDRQIDDRATLALRTYYRSEPGPWRRPVDSANVARLGSIIAARGPGEKQQEVRVATRLAGVAAIVLLIACANVVNLLLARAVRRRREIAVRLALGISRSRLVRLLVVESVMLALVAAGAAVLAAQWGGSWLRSLLLPDVDWATPTLNWHVAALAIGSGVAAGIVAGLVPAIQASRPDLAVALRGGARDGALAKSRLRSTLVMAQAALSVMLLAGAALFVKSLQNVHGLNIGFAADRLVFAYVRFDVPDSLRDRQIKMALEQVAERLRRMDGVERAALTGMEPMRGWAVTTWDTDKRFPEGKTPSTSFITVSPEYFAATGLRVIRGTGFPNAHGAAMPRVMVINDAMAKAIWPGENAVGRCMRFNGPGSMCYTILGVVENARRNEIIEDPKAQYYLPIDNMPSGRDVDATLIVRAAPERISQIEREIRLEIKRTWPSAIPHVTRMSDALERQYRPWRLGATLFSTFGLLALVIAAVGVFSTVSYGVSQRTHEFGVRVALGARTSDVVRLVIGGGLRTVAVGVVIGIGLALAGGRLIESLLYGIKPSSPMVIAIVAAILLGVSAIAAFAPAWRAARVDPVNALRAD